MSARRDTTPLAVALLAAYLVQAAMQIEVPWLQALQERDVYKIATGCAMVGYLWLQWSLASRRREAHVLLGAFAPLVLYAHASRFAYGYLCWLVAVYLGVGFVGMLHRPIVARRARRLFTWWFVTHVAMSALLVVLAGYHVVIAIAYE